MGNITGILPNNFAYAQAVSSRPNCLGLVKEARGVTTIAWGVNILGIHNYTTQLYHTYGTTN